MKACAFITDTLIDPATSHSEEPSGETCLRLFGTRNYFDYLCVPENEYLSARLQTAMRSLASSDTSTVVPGGFPWETLPKGTKIVDIGGGIGSACHEIMKKNPLLEFTIQDLQNVADQAIAVSVLACINYLGAYIEGGRVVLEPPRAQGDRERPGHGSSARFLLSSTGWRRGHIPA